MEVTAERGLETMDSGTEESQYQSLRAVATFGGYRTIAIVLTIGLLMVAGMLVYVPWQQSVAGTGKIIIFSPMERPQNIEAQIPARLKRWYVKDGQVVKQGELIAELSDLDSKFLDPEQSRRLKGQKQALSARRQAAQARYDALAKQLESLKRSQSVALPSASERAHQTTDRIWAAEQAVEAAQQTTVTADLNLERIRELHEKGLRSTRDMELAELDKTRAVTDLDRAKAALQLAKRDRTVAVLDQDKVVADTDAAMSNISAVIAAAQETIESTSSDIFKLEIDLENVSLRMEQRKVYAPTAGRILRLMRVGAGETVDAGAVLAVIVPDTEDLAAELMISDNDVPLVAVGRPVRLQFAGWPALQFSGWPSIAVGTFAGRIAVIDPVDDGRNSYRVIVKPDTEAIARGQDEPWPQAKFLRTGAEVHGWIMLDTVSLGFELWRQFNSFPPTVNPGELGLKNSSGTSSSDVKRKSK